MESLGKSLKAPKEVFFKSGKFRSIITQTLVLLLIIIAFSWIIRNTAINLTARGIASGFDFLWAPSSFDMGFLPFIDHDTNKSYFNAFLVGLLNTILVSILGIFFATILGFVIGIARLSDNFFISRFCGSYVELIRNIPLLLQILQLFFRY